MVNKRDSSSDESEDQSSDIDKTSLVNSKSKRGQSNFDADSASTDSRNSNT